MFEMPKHLPKRLTISFPLWLLYGTKGENSPYYDIEKAVREHAERGFNCIRIDSGAGLIHDQQGNRRGPFDVGDACGKFEDIPRQFGITGDGGACDLLGRLIETFEACKKHDIYVILSSWYYLHTYWFHKAGDPVCEELFALPKEERIDAFRKFTHYILLELEERGLDDQIAFVELFNEANDHPWVCGEGMWGGCRDISAEETALYKKQHEEAIGWLKEKHPRLLFAYDVSNTKASAENMPANADIYNFHNYYMWSLYDEALAAHPEWVRGAITAETVAAARAGRLPIAQGWYDRIARYNDLQKDCTAAFDEAVAQVFQKNRENYAAKRERKLMAALRNTGGKMPLVCGEGVTYIPSKRLLWEENSEDYWAFVKEGLALYKAAGLWGTVIRTCCGPEDPCWYEKAQKLLELNQFFLE